MSNLNIALVQFDIVWESIDENIALLNKIFEKILPETNWVILPEMFSTGFSMNVKNIAELKEGKIYNWMQTVSEKYNLAICGSVCTLENNLYYNRLFFFNEGKFLSQYDKRHLFSLAGEQKYYTAGKSRTIIEYNAWKILPQICYDLRFPVYSRNKLSSPYDIAVYVANWPKQRIDAWNKLLPARAIENQCFVIGVNRIGKDINENIYNGCSACFSPLGNKIEPKSIFKHEKYEIIQITIAQREIYETRRKFKFLNDADFFTIEEN